MTPLSTCCNAPVKAANEGAEGQTNYYVCTACGKACDPVERELGKTRPTGEVELIWQPNGEYYPKAKIISKNFEQVVNEELEGKGENQKSSPTQQLRDITEIQCAHGNWNYDPYMHGLANGLILALATIEEKDPILLKAPKKWIDDVGLEKELIGCPNCGHLFDLDKSTSPFTTYSPALIGELRLRQDEAHKAEILAVLEEVKKIAVPFYYKSAGGETWLEIDTVGFCKKVDQIRQRYISLSKEDE